MNKTCGGVLLLLMSASVYGANYHPISPGCDDERTKNVAIGVVERSLNDAFDEVGKKVLQDAAVQLHATFDSDIRKLQLSLSEIKTVGYELKTYTCTARLFSLMNGNTSEVPVTYTSKLVNDGSRFLVEVLDLDIRRASVLLSVMLTPNQ